MDANILDEDLQSRKDEVLALSSIYEDDFVITEESGTFIGHCNVIIEVPQSFKLLSTAVASASQPSKNPSSGDKQEGKRQKVLIWFGVGSAQDLPIQF